MKYTPELPQYESYISDYEIAQEFPPEFIQEEAQPVYSDSEDYLHDDYVVAQADYGCIFYCGPYSAVNAFISADTEPEDMPVPVQEKPQTLCQKVRRFLGC